MGPPRASTSRRPEGPKLEYDMRLGEFFTAARRENKAKTGNFLMERKKTPTGKIELQLTDMGAAILSLWLLPVVKYMANDLTWDGVFDPNHFALLDGSIHALIKPRRGTSDGKRKDGKRLAVLIGINFQYDSKVPPYVDHLISLLNNIPRGPLMNSYRFQLECHCAQMTAKGQMSLVGLLKNFADGLPNSSVFDAAVSKSIPKKTWFRDIQVDEFLRKVAVYGLPIHLRNDPTQVPPYPETPQGAFQYVRNYDTHVGGHCKDKRLKFDDGSGLVIPSVFGDFLAKLMSNLFESTLSDEIAAIARSCLPSPIYVDLKLLEQIEPAQTEGFLQCNEPNQEVAATAVESLEQKSDNDLTEAQDVSNAPQQSEDTARKPHINIVVIGHANSGKSTITGNLLFKLAKIDEPVIDGIKKEALEMNMKASRYAWLLDKLKAERERSTTIDVMPWKFETPNYCCTILDAPGHREFIKNMITATSQADCAVLIIDSVNGNFEDGMSKDGQTREHALLASALGVKQMICCCNKVDLTYPTYSEDRYNDIVVEVSLCLKKFGYRVENIPFIPVSGLDGDNLIDRSSNTKWYEGPTLLEAFDQITEPKRPSEQPLRLPIRGAYHLGGIGTVAVGCIACGTIKPGTTLKIGPSGLIREFRSLELETDKRKLQKALPGESIALTFDAGCVAPQDLKSGYVLSDVKNHPAEEAASFTAQVIIMNNPGNISNGYTPVMYCHSGSVPVRFDELVATVDRHSSEVLVKKPKFLKKGDEALVKMIPTKPMVVETYKEFPSLGRFVACDTQQVVAVGIIKDICRKKDHR